MAQNMDFSPERFVANFKVLSVAEVAIIFCYLGDPFACISPEDELTCYMVLGEGYMFARVLYS